MLAGGARYFAGLVPEDDAIAQMYEMAVERLASAGLRQYEISNFGRRGFQSRHNLRYWERRPYLGLGLDASSMLREDGREGAGYVLRSTTTDDLKAYLEGHEPGPPRTGLGPWGGEPAETAWLSPERQHEEAWFVGLRLNSGVKLAALKREFGREPVTRALAAVDRLVEDGMLSSDGKTIRLTAKGRLLSNDVFQEFLGVAEGCEATEERRA
jgi:oxygen-independent coproporphyrinogen-3 oxidase